MSVLDFVGIDVPVDPQRNGVPACRGCDARRAAAPYNDDRRAHRLQCGLIKRSGNRTLRGVSINCRSLTIAQEFE
jgi:hypothetical protein